MTDQALDFPILLAERAYAKSQVPDKASKARQDFIDHMAETRETMAAIAKTERQRTLLDAEMVIYRRGYIAELSKVLRAYSKTPAFGATDDQLSEFGKADMAFTQWRRKAEKGMKDNILNVERPIGRWQERVSQPTIVSGRSA